MPDFWIYNLLLSSCIVLGSAPQTTHFVFWVFFLSIPKAFVRRLSQTLFQTPQVVTASTYLKIHIYYDSWEQSQVLKTKTIGWVNCKTVMLQCRKFITNFNSISKYSSKMSKNKFYDWFQQNLFYNINGFFLLKK